MKKFGNLLGAFTLLMIVLSFLTVTIHFFFNSISITVQELILYLHAFAFMLGILFTYSSDSHVRIDIFYQKFKPSKQSKVNLLGTVFLLLPFFAFILYASFPYVLSSWQRLEGSSEPGGLPFVYLLKSLLIIMPALLMVYSFVKLIRKN